MQDHSLLQANLRFFEKKINVIFQQINGRDQSPTIEVVQGIKEKEWSLQFKDEQRAAFLHSKYAPREEAVTWVEGQELTGKRHIVLFGLGFGLHIEELVRKYPEVNIYIYEPDTNIFLATLLYKDWSRFPWEKVRACALEDGSGKYHLIARDMLNLVKDDWVFLSLPSFERLYNYTFLNFKQSLQQQSKGYIEGLGVNIHFEKEWTFNAVKNLPFEMQAYSIFKYKEFFAGKTVVMTASGPSLNDAIPYLEKIREEKSALIVAAGSSINALLSKGVKPDLFVSYDPFENNYLDMRRNLDKGVPMAFGSTLHPGIVAEHEGDKAFFVISQDTVFNYLLGALEDQEVIPDAPSIVIVTMILLYKLGVERIILAGQDLAFPGERRYADGVSIFYEDGKAKESEKQIFVEVESNSGEMVPTMDAFNSTRKGLESVIRQCGFKQILNTALHGAKIEGADYCFWEDVVNQLKPGNVKSVAFEKRDFNRQNIKSFKKKAEDALTSIQEAIEKIQKDGSTALAYFENREFEKGNHSFDSFAKRMIRLIQSHEYQALIRPMVRNEDMIVSRYIFDYKNMEGTQKRDFLRNYLSMFVSGVRLSIFKLSDAVNEWSA